MAVLGAVTWAQNSGTVSASGVEADRGNMLQGEWAPGNTHRIDYSKLPRIPAEHAVISDVRGRDGMWVHQHAYLAWHAGRFWAMWSDGPGVRRKGVPEGGHRNLVPGHDQAGTRVSYATSPDGVNWSKPGDLSGAPWEKGFGWIARGLWVRDGELLALASHFQAPGYAGEGLNLEAFRWDEAAGKWRTKGLVFPDSLNNFPPKKLPSGEWMMTRRDHDRQVSVMVGGVKAFNDWRVHPMAAYDGDGRPEEPYWYVLPDGQTIVGLIRDNGGSKMLLRTFSTDNGKTWSRIERTNFPDATSKFFVHRTTRGYYVMASSSNPRKRDPLTLAVSRDGLVFDKLFWLVGDRHIDYPHIIERDGHLLVAFSGAKQTMEVMKVSLDDLEALEMPESVEVRGKLPPVTPPRTGARPWIDLGDEGKRLYVRFDLRVPPRGEEALVSLATASGLDRVMIGVGKAGSLKLGLYQARGVADQKLPVGEAFSILAQVDSRRAEPDELKVHAWPAGQEPSAKGAISSTLKGSSDADLAAIKTVGAAFITGEVRVAPTLEGLNEMDSARLSR